MGSLLPGITYSLRVLAFTAVGDGPPSPTIQVKTQQGGRRRPGWVVPLLPRAVSWGVGGGSLWDDESPYLHTRPLGRQGGGGVRPCLLPLGAPALGGLARLMAPGWGVAVPAQPADFQAEADSDTRIQLSWLLPPQERIVKYELVYWAAEDEGQQVSTQQCGGRGAAPGPWGSVLGSPRQAFLDSGVMGTQPRGSGTLAGLCGPVVFVTPVLGTELLSPSWVSSALWLSWHQQSPQVPQATMSVVFPCPCGQ